MPLRPITEDLIAEARLACKLVGLAYVFSQTGACVMPDGFSPPRPIALKVPRSCDPMLTWGFDTEINGRWWRVLRGTQARYDGKLFAGEWTHDDLNPLPMKSWPGGGRVHGGFSGLYEALDAITPALPGARYAAHSLSVSAGAMLWLRDGKQEILHGFNGPRIGNYRFSKLLDGALFWNNSPDPVHTFPWWPFHPGGQQVNLNGPGSFFNQELAHSLEACEDGLITLAASL